MSEKQQPQTFKQRLRVAVFGEAAETAAERKLLRKIDFFILTYCCISFLINYLDRAALTNAYISGMKEALHFQGRQLNVVATCLTCGYIIGGPFHAIMIQKVSPRIWFSSMCLLWGGLTMTCAAAKNYRDLCAIRFLQGIAEASTFSGTQYVIGSWYKPAEIGKRTGLFAASGMAGTMFSGLMMTAMYKTMNGRAGLAGWQWLYIILGIINVPVAIFGFIFFPDLPETTTSRFLTEEEKELAVARLPPKRQGAGHKLGWSLFRRVLLSPAFWAFTGLWVVGGALEALNNQGCFSLFIASFPKTVFSIPDRNNFPLGQTAVGIFATLLTAVAIDFTGKHMPFGYIACGIQVISCIILLCWYLPIGAKFAAYYIAGTAYMIQPVCFAWANKTLSKTGDDAMRAMTLYAMNSASSVLFAFWGLILYPASDAPRYHKGVIAMICVAAVLAVWITFTWRLEISVNRKYEAAIHQAEVSADEQEKANQKQVEDEVEDVELGHGISAPGHRDRVVRSLPAETVPPMTGGQIN